MIFIYILEYKKISVTPQIRGVSLTTRQPAKYSWMSGNPTPLTKIGQNLLCTESSTQGKKPVPTINNDHTGSTCKENNCHLGSCINTHKITYQLYTNSLRVDTSLLIQTYIKIKNLIHVSHNPCQATCRLSPQNNL